MDDAPNSPQQADASSDEPMVGAMAPAETAATESGVVAGTVTAEAEVGHAEPDVAAASEPVTGQEDRSATKAASPGKAKSRSFSLFGRRRKRVVAKKPAVARHWEWWRVAAGLAAIPVAIRAQQGFDGKLNADGVILFFVALVLWAFALYADWRVRAKPPSAAAEGGDAPRPDDFPAKAPIELGRPGPVMTSNRRVLLQIGLAWVVLTALAVPFVLGPTNPLAILSYPQGDGSPQNSLTIGGTILWLGGLLLVLAAVAEYQSLASRLRNWKPEGSIQLRYDASLVGLAIAFGLAVLYRFWDLTGVPRELTSDHTEKIKDVALIVGGLRPVFLPNNGGREALEFYWLALLVTLGLPLSFITLKIGMGIVSTLTIPVMYRLGRELGGRVLGVAAALTLALLPWHIQITRIGLRIAFSPLFATLALFFLFQALRTGRRNDWVGLGLSMGFGLFGYTGFRLIYLAVPVILLAALLARLVQLRRSGLSVKEEAGRVWRPLLANIAVTVTIAVIAAAPLIRYAADRPEAFWGRSMTRMTSTERPLDHPPAEQLAINMKNALLMFNVTSDSAWFHSPPGRPALETVGGGLLILGLLTALYFVLAGSWQLAVLLPVVVIMLLPSALALAFPNEVPHLSRSAGAIPAVVLLTGLPLVVLLRWLSSALGRIGTLVGFVLAAALFVQMGQNTWERYFHEYRETYDRSTHRPTLGAEVARGFVAMGGDMKHVYNVGWDNGWDYRVIGIEMGQPDWEGNLWGKAADGSDAVEAARGQVGDPSRKLYLVGGPDAPRRVDFLKGLFPNALATHHEVPGQGKDFWSVLVPEATATAPPGAVAPDGTPPANPASDTTGTPEAPTPEAKSDGAAYPAPAATPEPPEEKPAPPTPPVNP